MIIGSGDDDVTSDMLPCYVLQIAPSLLWMFYFVFVTLLVGQSYDPVRSIRRTDTSCTVLNVYSAEPRSLVKP